MTTQIHFIPEMLYKNTRDGCFLGGTQLWYVYAVPHFDSKSKPVSSSTVTNIYNLIYITVAQCLWLSPILLVPQLKLEHFPSGKVAMCV